jgi:hypothetical protein
MDASAAYRRVAMRCRGALGWRRWMRVEEEMRCGELKLELGGALTRWAAEGINERTYSCSEMMERGVGRWV